jgi:hypothetical protein
MPKIESILTENLLEPSREIAIFEHGVGNSGSGGCGVVHAHQHYVTLPLGTVSRIREKLRSSLQLVSTGNRYELLGQLANGRSYVSFGDLEDTDIFDGTDVPSQLVRRFIGADLGIAWNWRDFVNWDWFDDGMSRLPLFSRVA